MLLNVSYTAILKTAIADVTSVLTTFSSDPLFAEKFALVFGTTISSEQFLQTVAVLPQIEVRSDAELNGALGAFSAQTQKIYLSESLLKGDLVKLRSVLIEEIGHFVDAQVNSVDSPGDEGAIFAAVVLGKSLSNEVLQALKTEDDRGIIVVDGEAIAGEMADSYDPTQVWVKQFCSSEEDKPWDIGIDSNNNIYVVGETLGSLSDNNNLGFSDAFFTKYDASGNQLWVKQFGSSDSFDSDYALGITLDNNNNIYVTGYTFGSLPGNSNLGIIDAFLAKYDTNGNQLWIQQFGSNRAEIAQKVTVDGSGNLSTRQKM
jgi:hypothetical protein